MKKGRNETFLSCRSGISTNLVQGPSFWLCSHLGTTGAEIRFSLSVISERAELQALDFWHDSGGQGLLGPCSNVAKPQRTGWDRPVDGSLFR